MEDVNGVSEENLKKTLLGLDNYLFLINDSNHELDQHFNPDYESSFNPELFSENFNFKRNLLSKDFGYYYFIVPDKSVVCREFLPFDTSNLKRNIDLIDGVNDFADFLDETDYFRYDTHINYQGGKNLTFKFLNHINPDLTEEKFNNLIDKADKYDQLRHYDLLVEKNWSYSEELKNEFTLKDMYTLPKPKGLTSIEDYPEVFKWCGIRKSGYYKNDDSFSDLRVVVFGDSTFKLIQPYLTLYFKELFFYWDHGLFNEDLVSWFNPDLIIEIRMERFIESIPMPDWVLNKEEIDLSKQGLMDRLLDKNNDLVSENELLNKKLKKVVRKNKILNNQLDEVLNSNSWKITKPLRKIKNLK